MGIFCHRKFQEQSRHRLVIAGSDKRGTIYGIYDVSQQIGVSPFYWWTDVPVQHHDELFVAPGAASQGPPAVKYRGIFLNDEAPDLTGWADEKFGGYNHKFYTNIFELLLRLRANYLWPAMWNNCFSADDPLNPQLADAYGIVMGTSHVEPMMRADKEWGRAGFRESQWNYDKNPAELRDFWRTGLERNSAFENIVTIGMRGKVDTPMSPTANIALLEKIVAAQREIIGDVMKTNVQAVPQLWCLYKEVQEYYEKGMRVPDDVTLLWSDDNWGDLRRLPTPGERQRSGGAGIYYHLDYVGGPRNYKWLNSSPLPKIREQMSLAWQYGADRIWIVNVGHLHHVTFPMEFFLTMAWKPSVWTPERTADFGRLWARREFGPEHAGEIADLVARYTKYNGRRKPELISESTFSIVNYNEAERIAAEWAALVKKAVEINERLRPEFRDAFYELVLHPVKACAILNDLYVAAAQSRLFAAQGRVSANDYADAARKLFREDAALSGYFNHTFLNGKWDHMMDQTHIGYTTWQQPPRNNMPPVGEVQPRPGADMGVAVEGSTNAWPGQSSTTPQLPSFDAFSQQRHYIDIFNRGMEPFKFTANSANAWIKLSRRRGEVTREERIWVEIDESKAPRGRAQGNIEIRQAGVSTPVIVNVNSFNPSLSRKDSTSVFMESDGLISIEAEHFKEKSDSPQARWEKLPDYGRTLSAMTISPSDAQSVLPPAQAPCLVYDLDIFDTGIAKAEVLIAPTLNFVPGRGLRFALSVDDESPKTIDALSHNSTGDWEKSVADSVRKVVVPLEFLNPGHHKLKLRMVDPDIVVEKIVLDFGGVRPSYLGPPESYRTH
jgi:hypothetical protein